MAEAESPFMLRALALARRAAAEDEVPVGAVVVLDGEVIGEGHNRCEALTNPTRHAEIEALDRAFAAVGEGRLPGAVLYATLEPCFMCCGALLHARVAKIVYAARDPKFGACGSLANLPLDARLNHRCAVEEGDGRAASAAMLRAFFRARRG